MNLFLRKNKNHKIIVLDIPLLVENKLNKKGDVLIFVEAKKKDIKKRLIKRNNYNKKLFDNFRKIQKPLIVKKKLSTYTIKNNFKLITIKKNVKLIKDKLLHERNST